jgi:hypothetical protein
VLHLGVGATTAVSGAEVMTDLKLDVSDLTDLKLALDRETVRMVGRMVIDLEQPAADLKERMDE